MLVAMARRTQTPKPPSKPAPDPKKRRKPATRGMESAVGGHLADLRGKTARRVIAEQMQINGAPHPRVVNLLKRLADEGRSKNLNGSLARIIEHIEDGKHSISLSEFVAVCEVYEVEPARVLEATGFSRLALTIEDAVDGDPRLNVSGKRRLIQDLNGYLGNPAFTA